MWAPLLSGNALTLTCSFVAPCPKYPGDCSEHAASLSTVGNQKQDCLKNLISRKAGARGLRLTHRKGPHGGILSL